MSIIKLTRNTLYQIGIPYVLLGSDKLHSTNREKLLLKSDLEPAAQIFHSSPTRINNSDRQAKKHCYTFNLCEYWCIVLGSHSLSNIALEINEIHCLVTRVLKTLILCALFAWIYLQESGEHFHETNNCCAVQVNVKFTVKSLHAGTLVTCWTTAPRKPFLYKRLAQLASILFLFFILTIVTQCYSSTYATKPELELAKPLPKFSPTLDSRIHSSSLILSRIIQAHFVEKEVPHYHHVLLHLIGRRKRELTKHNLNHISEVNFIPKTRKRVHVKVKEIGDKSYLNRIRGKSESKTQRSESAERTEISTQRQNGENLSDFVSVAGNFSRVISQKLNQSNFGVGSSDKQIFQEKTAQPMPPAYGHTDNSYTAVIHSFRVILDILDVKNILSGIEILTHLTLDMKKVKSFLKHKTAVDKWRVLSIILSSVALTVTLGLITCILSHYREGAAPEGGGTASDPNNAALTPTSAPMLSVVSAGATAGVGGMERLRGGRVAARDLAAAKERQVRLHALRTDLAVNLPPSITMPDGEDHPYSNSRIQIRDPEQEAEIYQKCIRPPPNRTVLESESPPPYRSSSAGLLGSSSSSSSSNDWSSSGGGGNAPLVVRCHSMSSTTNTTRRPESASSGQKTDFLQRTVKIFTGKKSSPQAPSPAPTLPAVVVPSGSRRRPPEQNPPPSTHRPSKGGV